LPLLKFQPSYNWLFLPQELSRTGLCLSYVWSTENEYSNALKSPLNNGHGELPHESELIALHVD